MNLTEAKILWKCNQLDADLRYAEYIAARMQMNYRLIASYMRGMEIKGWLQTTRYKHRKVVVVLTPQAVLQAKEVLDNVN